MLGAGYDVNLDLWCFVDTEHLIIMEVALLHASTVKRALTLESSTEPEDDSAFRLSHNAVRINNTTAVNRGHHTMNANRIRLAASRQRVYQYRHALKGLCVLCPQTVEGTSCYCAKHKRQVNEAQRKRYHAKKAKSEVRS